MTSPRRVLRFAAPLVAILVVGVLLLQTFHKAERPGGNDFTSYLLSARALAQGTSPYDTGAAFPYLYPMFLAALLIPLAFVPYSIAVFVWFAASLGALCASLARVAVLSRPELEGRPALVLRLTVLLLVPFVSVVQNNLLNGQVNFLVLLCCVLFFSSFREGRASLAPAALLGTAIALKILPLVLVPLLLVRRRLSLVAGALAWAALLSVFPLLFVGFAGAGAYADYARSVLLGGLLHPPGGHALDFSLHGVVRALVPLPAVSRLLAILLSATLVGALAWIDARSRTGGGDSTVPFTLYLAAIPLLSPMSETHHLAFVLPGALLCWIRLARDPDARRGPDLVLFGSFVGLYLAGHVAGRFAGASRGPLWCLSVLALGLALARRAREPARLDGCIVLR